MIDDGLQSVNLANVADDGAGTYSGGMQRRLSCAIAALGDPAVVFMDEPTTGMDPMNRKHLWDMIEDLKKDRVVILTTHSMEEAEHLGDRIGIMSGGEVTALGTSLFLKSHVGGDYELRVIALDRERMEQKLKSFVPEAILIDNSAGALKYSVGKEYLKKLPPLFRWLESEGKEVVKEWGLQQTTLEEVFIRLARKADGKSLKETAAARRTHSGLLQAGETTKASKSSISDISIEVNSEKNGKKRGSLPEHKVSSDHHMEMNSVRSFELCYQRQRIEIRGTHAMCFSPRFLLCHPSTSLTESSSTCCETIQQQTKDHHRAQFSALANKQTTTYRRWFTTTLCNLLVPTGLVGLLFLIQLATNGLQPEAQLAKAQKQCESCKYARKALCQNFTIYSAEDMYDKFGTYNQGDSCVVHYNSAGGQQGDDYCYSGTPFCGCHFDATSLAKKAQNVLNPSKCYPFQ